MSTLSVAPSAAADPLRGYLPVHVDMLQRVDRAPVDIYIQADRGTVPTLYCRAGLPMENQQLYGLSEAGIRDVYVRNGDFEDFGLHVLESVQSKIGSDEFSPADQFAALQLAVAVEVDRTSRLIDCSRFVGVSQRVGRDLTALLASSHVRPCDLYTIARHDFSTFTHATNVASYSILLAERMGITDDHDLEQIATAALLHDIGKRFIPASILNKPTRLDPDERDVIESHPTRGYEDLCDRPELTHGQLMIVYQHHERVDGNGYPVGQPAADIHPWAKLVSIVDVFDAMTGRRPYRKPIPASEALKYIQRNAGTHFDPEMAKCWISAMKKA